MESVPERHFNGVARKTPAVVIRNAYKHYKKGVPVLENLCMTVQRGVIYSLLGSNGCGKTTALSCIVGASRLNAGNIWVFEAPPGVKGRLVGYMPQETSLYGDFSIEETLMYFGTLCGMDRASVLKQIQSLTKLLRLPHSSRYVGTLSGGQKRRISLAVAIIHEPDLIVLDEPTVGVDPLLRESIRQHLVDLSTKRGATILITTHSLDEAKTSNIVGVLRDGHLLVEHSPSQLLLRFDTNSLETVVLKLCQKKAAEDDPMSKFRRASTFQEKYSIELPDDSEYTPPVQDHRRKEKLKESAIRIKSLVHKNLLILFRNLLLLLFSALLPAFIVAVMIIGFKSDPNHLPFGVVNHEVASPSICQVPPKPLGECDVENLSCKFVDNLPKHIFDLVYYNSVDDAQAAVHAGSSWGYMTFPQNYSSIFYERAAGGANVDEMVLNMSEIVVRMDQTNKIIYGRMKKSLHDAFEDYVKSILRNCGFNERQAEDPLNFQTPIFGTGDINFVDFVAPGSTTAWLFFFPIIAASIRYINEKKQGTFERSLVAGTKTWEIMLAYGATECIVLILQSVLVYFILTVLLNIEILGSPVLVLILSIMSGFAGVSMGFFIGSMCNEEIEAALLAMCLFFPNFLISGIIWPVEGMPLPIQYVSYVLPCTLSVESMRSLFARGWEFTHPKVWPGFLTLFLYIVICLFLTVILQKIKYK